MHGYTTHNHPCCGEAKPNQKRVGIWIHRCGGPTHCGKVCSIEAAQLHATVEASYCSEPHLGLATTRELLAELKVRGDVGAVGESNFNRYRTLAWTVKTLLEAMPKDVLDYRTVDSD